MYNQHDFHFRKFIIRKLIRFSRISLPTAIFLYHAEHQLNTFSVQWLNHIPYIGQAWMLFSYSYRMSACKRRFIIYNLCKEICNIFTHFPIKTSFSLGIASHSLVSKESSLKHINDSFVNTWRKALTHSESNRLSLFLKDIDT